METAIKKAIEGGYKEELKYISSISGEYIYGTNDSKKNFKYPEIVSGILLDPLFWQALGKTEGWKELKEPIATYPLYQMHPNGDITTVEKKPLENWLYAWHRFVDHLAEGKDIDSFFNELIK